MMKVWRQLAVVLTVGIISALLTQTATAKPRLVLQITVDGLRYDLIERYQENYGEGGFRYLLDEGVVYSNAHYQHANTETIVGHTTLATGATPAIHGMVGNVWYHADSGKLGYNIEDAEAPLLPTRTQSSQGAQVDPAQLRANSSGRSPKSILVPTFADTLSQHTAGKSKIFGISGKDRSAVAIAGKAGTAYWYSTDNGDFQSSQYYMDDYPQWVTRWNGARTAESYANSHWQLHLPLSAYVLGHQDDRPYEVDLKGYGRTFPHPFGETTHPLFFTRLLVSPRGDSLLLDFGKTLLEAEKLGQDDVTDYLSISFSAVDAVNHFFGPSSLENEAVILALDKTLAELFQFIDKTVGLENTLTVFAADHGMPELAEYATELGHNAGRIYGKDILEQSRQFAAEQYGSGEVIRDFFRPYLYLDEDKIAELKLDIAMVARDLAENLLKMNGVAGAVSSYAMPNDKAGPMAAVRNNFHPQRAGAVYVFQSPYWFMMEKGAIAAMHGSPWSYDTHVPIIFVGKGIAPRKVNRKVHPVDVAPTLSALVGISPPAGAVGKVLKEADRN